MYLHFIVNPISGKGNHVITKAFLEQYFNPEAYHIEVEFSAYKKHAVILTEKAIVKNPDCIIACGGDGTINEVASCLVDTGIPLGILPVGSGNGLAANLGIPQDIVAALAILQRGTRQMMDVGCINNHYFFSNMGLGIDALIIKNYETAQKRTLGAYIKASLAASTAYTVKPVTAFINGKKQEYQPFLLFVSNSNQMGYGMSLTPGSSLFDGRLDMLYVPQLTIFQKLYFGLLVLTNKADKFSKAAYSSITDDIIMELPENIFTDVQIDGEYYNLKTNKITISVLPKSLVIIR
jgi:YegS/Rv2252/BmrU family lipid kinase